MSLRDVGLKGRPQHDCGQAKYSSFSPYIKESMHLRKQISHDELQVQRNQANVRERYHSYIT